MPYPKNKQQAFQAAQGSVNQAMADFLLLIHDDVDYASRLEHVKHR
ncbi:hypothetical protein [Bacillus sp. V5-8f]|nr:hypothetical protein [Bacillus sp. V5-8f]